MFKKNDFIYIKKYIKMKIKEKFKIAFFSILGVDALNTFGENIENMVLKDTVRFGKIEVAHKCNFKMNTDAEFYNNLILEIDDDQYNCWVNCMDGANRKCIDVNKNRFELHNFDIDGICFFWNLNYYHYDKYVTIGKFNGDFDDFKLINTRKVLRGWSYDSSPMLYHSEFVKDETLSLIGLGSGLRKISLPLNYKSINGGNWGDMINIRFDESTLKNIPKIDDINVNWSDKYGIIGNNAGLFIDWNCIMIAYSQNIGLVKIEKNCMQIRKMDKYLEKQSDGQDYGSNVDNIKRRYIEVQNCQEHTEYIEPVSGKTIIESIVVGGLTSALNFIPIVGPIIGSGVSMIIDAADNPRTFSERMGSHITDIGKESGKVLWDQIKDKVTPIFMKYFNKLTS